MCAPVLLSIPALGVQECCYFTLTQKIQTDSVELWTPSTTSVISSESLPQGLQHQ